MTVETMFLDIENADKRLLLTGWAFDEDDVEVDEYVNLGHQVITALADPTITTVSHTGHDPRFFMRAGYEVAGPWHNTAVMAWFLDENQPLDLGSLVARYAPAQGQKTKHIRSVNGVLCFGTYALQDYDAWPESARRAFATYCKNDVHTLRELYRSLARSLVVSERMDLWQEHVQYSSVLLRMECRGLPVNLDDAAELAREVRAERDRAAAQLRRSANLPKVFNLNSPKQVREYLFSKWFTIPDKLPMTQEVLPPASMFEIQKVGRDYIHGVWTLRGRNLMPTDPPKRKDKEGDEGDPSTASPELLYKHGQDAWVNTLCLDYRRNDKLLGTYLEKFPRIAVGEGRGYVWRDEAGTPVERGEVLSGGPLPRIYGRFNQTGTVTGRLSSSEPNLQNIPARREVGKRVRALFQGRFVIGDYDALEMRLMAHFSRDPRLVAVFKEGGDPHALTARALFGVDVEHDSAERDIAKTVNYAIGYGAGAKKLAQTLTLAGFPTTFGTAKDYIALVEGFYPRLYSWKNRVIWRAKDIGFVTTIGGHNRHLRGNLEDVASWKQMSYGERQAVNSVVQGSAADILRRVMLNVDRWYARELRLLAQIHDELIWEYDEMPDTELLSVLQKECEQGHGYKLRVPLSFVPVVCSDWSQKGEGVDLSLLTSEDE